MSEGYQTKARGARVGHLPRLLQLGAPPRLRPIVSLMRRLKLPQSSSPTSQHLSRRLR
jgi:hypothetical protein